MRETFGLVLPRFDLPQRQRLEPGVLTHFVGQPSTNNVTAHFLRRLDDHVWTARFKAHDVPDNQGHDELALFLLIRLTDFGALHEWRAQNTAQPGDTTTSEAARPNL